MKYNNAITVAIADDHQIFTAALQQMVNGFANCRVLFTAANGQEVMSKIKSGQVPDVFLLDMRMPVMDGFETAIWLRRHFPKINILILTMYDTSVTLHQFLRIGVKGILKKNVDADELFAAIVGVAGSNGCTPFFKTGEPLPETITPYSPITDKPRHFSEQEIKFLKWAASDLSYKEIAARMNVKTRMVEAMRYTLFQKLHVNSRAGLAVYAYRHGLINF
jgi:two-component system, NarL family, invasion response regulator UvrY